MITLSGDIWERWRMKHRELAETGKWENLAGLFQGDEGSNFRHAYKKVLYTGKATAGPFTPQTADETYFGCNKGAFWKFARRLNTLTGGNGELLENIAWSNLCKIGVARGNPPNDLVEAQKGLCIETLRQEWRELKPSLVIFVTEGFQDNLVYEAIGPKRGEDYFQPGTRNGFTYYNQPAMNGLPAFLWMKHPQGKRREYIETAASFAEEMLGHV